MSLETRYPQPLPGLASALCWGSWAGMPGHQHTRPCVLVAEPRRALRAQIGRALEEAGLTVEFAADVAQAARLASAKRYSAAVVDPAMDGGRGLALCRRLARGDGVFRTPVVALHDSDRWWHRVRTRLTGVRASLVRPLSLDRFVDIVSGVARPPARVAGIAPRIV